MHERSKADLVWCLGALAWPLLLPGFGALVSFVWVIALLMFRRPSRQPTLAMWMESRLASIAIGVGVGVLVAALSYFLLDPALVKLTGREIDLSNFEGVRGHPEKLAMLLALGVLFGGVVEELIFRGFIIGWGSRLLGDRSAMPLAVVSAIVFGLAHLYQGISGVIETGLIGLVYGLIYVGCGRKLVPAMAAHMTSNIIGILVIYYGV